MQHDVFFFGIGDSYNNPLRHTLQQGHPPALVWKSNGGNMRLPCHKGQVFLLG